MDINMLVVGDETDIGLCYSLFKNARPYIELDCSSLISYLTVQDARDMIPFLQRFIERFEERDGEDGL